MESPGTQSSLVQGDDLEAIKNSPQDSSSGPELA